MAIARHWLATARTAATQLAEARVILGASSGLRTAALPPQMTVAPQRLGIHTCVPASAPAAAAEPSKEHSTSSSSSEQQPASGKPADAANADNGSDPIDDGAGERTSSAGDAEADSSEETTSTSDASSSSGAAAPAKPSRLSFVWDVLKEAVGLGGPTGGPSLEKSAAIDFPWVEFPGSDGTVRYRNRTTGEVTDTMPEGFEQYGRALEVDTETTALAVVAVKQTRWDRYREMLSDSPFMRALDEAAAGIRDSEVAHRVGAVREDLQTQWETSQNPLVYRAASAYEAVFAETEQARAVARIQELDPKFDGGAAFLGECREVIIPRLVSALLRGDRVELDGWCTSECMARVNAVLRARESEALSVDSTILSTSQVVVAGAKVLETGPPMVLVTGMVQQLHCIRNKDVSSLFMRASLPILACLACFSRCLIVVARLRCCQPGRRQFLIAARLRNCSKTGQH